MSLHPANKFWLSGLFLFGPINFTDLSPEKEHCLGMNWTRVSADRSVFILTATLIQVLRSELFWTFLTYFDAFGHFLHIYILGHSDRSESHSASLQWGH